MKAFHYTANSAAKLIESIPPDMMKTIHVLAGKLALPIVRTTRARILDWAEDLKSIEALLETFQTEPKPAPRQHQPMSAVTKTKKHRTQSGKSPKR